MRILTILLLSLLFSCKSENKKEELNKDSKIVFNKLLNADFIFPNEFELTTIEEFEQKLSNSRSNLELTQINIGNLEKLKSLSDISTLYTDNENTENYIFITKGEFIDFNKNIASQYSSMLNNSVSTNWSNFNIEFKLLENKYTQNNQLKIIKIKYEQEFNKVKKFITQYLISGKGKTFSIMVCNFEDKDFEQEFKKIVLK